MKNSNIKRKLGFYLGLISVFVLIVMLSKIIPTDNLRFGQGEIFSLNEGWEISYGNNSFENLTLPQKLGVPKNQLITAQVKIPDNFPDDFKLRIRSSMQDIQISIENKEVFKTAKPNWNNFEVPEASVWYIVDLPSNIQGKTLTMNLSSSIKAFSGTINPIYAGAGETLLYKTISEQTIGLLMALFIFAFGIFSLIISISVRNLNDNRISYLGIFFILISIWVFSETRLVQLLTGNRFVIGGISYMMLSLIPIPFVLYLRDAIFIKNKRILTLSALFFMMNLFFNVAFQLWGVNHFIESIIFTNAMIAILLLFIVIQLFVETIKLKNVEAKNFLMYISILVLFLLIELYYFYEGYYNYTSVFARIGIMTFLFFIAGSTFKQLDELVLKEKEAEVMKRLAYTDILTGGNNRAAYERDLDRLVYSSKKTQFRVVIMDINDLKFVNDNFGHAEGDKMLKQFYQIITNTFDSRAKIYRLGGDEFTCILEDIDDYMFTQNTKKIKKALKELSSSLDYNIDVAIGSDIFSNMGDEKLKDFLDRIDKLMYANKRFMKQH
ncbi:MAG: GGDEF domain-containing protein [Gudongella sp.]|nr:GGDEF domain-containing protein [Gudongella sp.]